MALFIRKFIKNICTQQIRMLAPYLTIHTSHVAFLYSSSALGIDGYLDRSKQRKHQYAGQIDKFKTKMQQYVTDEKCTILTDDLKTMIHIAEAADLKLVTDMVKKFNSQKSVFKFKPFVFGPIVMRLFYFLDAPADALKSFFDPVNDDFYNQLFTYQILLDLLYNNQMFDEMFQVFEVIQNKQLTVNRYPMYPTVLIFAACYKQNTPESLDYAKELWIDINNLRTEPFWKATAFLCGLALKQGQPDVALELLSFQKHNYDNLRDFKVVALLDMGRIDDVLPLLRQSLDAGINRTKYRFTFLEDTVTRIRKGIEESKNNELLNEFDNIEKSLRNHGLIENTTLDHFLTAEITSSPKSKNHDKRNAPGKSYRFHNPRDIIA